MNPHTKKGAIFNAERICDFLNQRFGYRFALEKTLESIGIKPDMVAVMSGLARNRNIEAFLELLRIAAPIKEGDKT